MLQSRSTLDYNLYAPARIEKMKQTQPVLALILFSMIVPFAAWADSAPKLTPALLAQGKKLYTTNCASCHGAKGDGKGEVGVYMSPSPRNFTKDKFKKGDQVTDVFNTIKTGLPGTGMPAFPKLTPDERWALSYYVLSFRKNKSK